MNQDYKAAKKALSECIRLCQRRLPAEDDAKIKEQLRNQMTEAMYLVERVNQILESMDDDGEKVILLKKGNIIGEKAISVKIKLIQ